MTEEMYETAQSSGPAPETAPENAPASPPESASAPPPPVGEEVNAGGPQGPIGLDIGTANVVISRKNGAGETDAKLLQNAFYTIPYSRLTQKTLIKDDTPFFKKDNKLYILGDAAEDFANMFGGDTRRPIESGIINPREHEGVDVIKAIVDKLIDVPHKSGEKICFSAPGEPLDGAGSVVYHESIVKMHLKSLGYEPEPVNEGLTVVLSELADNNYTGIGLSIGGGMCNVCFSYLSVPVITYSIQKGGDYIDSMVGGSVGEPSTKIKRIKESDLDLAGDPKNRIETGLHIYYDDLFSSLAQSLRQVLGSSENIPRLSKAVPLVLSGGSVMPNGSRDKFMKALNEVRLPIRISDILVTESPLYATANGALAMAMIEEEDF